LYWIHGKTQAIKSETKGIYKTKIIEENNIVRSHHKAITILEENCYAYGAGLQGRFGTVERILESRTKLPIPVEPILGFYFFPTTSKRNSDCIWLSYYHILRVGEMRNKSYICLRDNTVLHVKTSLNQLDKQIKRTSQVIAYYHYLFLNWFR